MSSLVIVAIPAEDDYVHKISSEKVPHMTLLFLGEDAMKIKNLSKIISFVEHAANTSLLRFSLDVDRRGELGPEKADVLFFSKTVWSGLETVKEYRSNLLKEPNIRTAYDSTEQFSEWMPHLTLGYPDTPAKEDDRDYPGINYVSFDRIAVWFGDYEGVEFPLKRYSLEAEMAMSDSTKGRVDSFLSHFGVKGMKWGVRRSQAQRVGDVFLERGLAISTPGTRARGAARAAKIASTPVKVTEKGKKLKTSGGRGRPAHSDAVRARTHGQVGKKSGLKALSNEELQVYAHRLQLEQNVKRLRYNEMNPGKKFVATLLGQSGKSLASEGVNKGTKEIGKRAVKLATTR